MDFNVIIESAFSIALFVNAALFVPQIYKIIREKSARGVSLVTFLGFLIIQLLVIFHGLINSDWILIAGYGLSVLSCGTVVGLVLLYRNKPNTFDADITLPQVLASLPGHIYWKDKQGVVKGCNLQQAVDLGFKSVEEMIGKTDYDFTPKELANQIVANDREVMRTGKFQVVEEECNIADGSVALYLSYKSPLRNDRNEIVGIAGVSLDITEIRDAEIERKNFLENIIALMPGHVYWLDRNCVYLGCNDIQAKSAGLASRKEIVGKRNEDLPWNINSSLSRELDKTNKEVMESGIPKVVEEAGNIKDGKKAIFLSSKVPLRDNRGKVVGLLGISIDITHLKQLEAALRQAKEEADSANKAKSEFLANMSHDLKTPLTGIISAAEYMALIATNSQIKEFSEDIFAAGRQLLEFFNNFLELSKIENADNDMTTETFNFRNIINDVYALCKLAITKKGLNFKVYYDDNIPKNLLGNRAKIHRILLNLVSNAIKFTDTGAITIKVNASKRLSQKEIIIKLVVEDTGIGIPKNKFNVIFEKLTRLTPSYEGRYEGSGIGLHIVKKFVDTLHGEIKVDSEPGKGSAFTVVLPLQIPLLNEDEYEDKFFSNGVPVIDMNSKTTSLKQLKRKSSHILLVEDNLIAQKTTMLMLKSLGCSVDVAENGEKALSHFTPGKYDLVIMDIGLPDMDGYAIAKIIRKFEKGTAFRAPIVALTAHAAQGVQNYCSDSGMDAVLAKPLRIQQAKELVDKFTADADAVITQDIELHSVEISRHDVPLDSMLFIDLDEGAKLLNSDRVAAKEFIYHLLQDLPYYRQELSKAYKSGDRHSLLRAMHKFHGGLCYVGVPRLRVAAQKLHDTLLKDSDVPIHELYQILMDEMTAFEQTAKTMDDSVSE